MLFVSCSPSPTNYLLICSETFIKQDKSQTKEGNKEEECFTGSELWKLGSKGCEKMEATYNKSIKIMFDLPLATHRFLNEPISGSPHVTRTLVKRYLSFIESIKKSKKVAVRELLEVAQRDVRTTTGHNMRFIMLKTGQNRVENLMTGKIDFDYHVVTDANGWKIDFIRELIGVRNDDLNVDGMNWDELEEILEYLCTS